jgi:hypothetical protein
MDGRAHKGSVPIRVMNAEKISMTRLTRRAWLPTILFIGTSCLGAPGTDWPRTRVIADSARPDESFFQTAAINPTDDELRAPSGPQSKIPGLVVGQPAPAFRTLGEAARAGVNPLAQGGARLAPLMEAGAPPPRGRAGMVVGALALLCLAGVGGVIVLRSASTRARQRERLTLPTPKT